MYTIKNVVICSLHVNSLLEYDTKKFINDAKGDKDFLFVVAVPCLVLDVFVLPSGLIRNTSQPRHIPVSNS